MQSLASSIKRLAGSKGAHSEARSLTRFEKRKREMRTLIRKRRPFWPPQLAQRRLDALERNASKISKPAAIELANGFKLTMGDRGEELKDDAATEGADTMADFNSGMLNALKVMQSMREVYTPKMIDDRTRFAQTSMTGLGGAFMKDQTRLELLETFILKHGHRTLWMPHVPDTDIFYTAILKESKSRGSNPAPTDRENIKPVAGTPTSDSTRGREAKGDRNKRLKELREKTAAAKKAKAGPPANGSGAAKPGTSAKAPCYSRTMAGKVCYLESQGKKDKCRFEHACCAKCGGDHTFDACKKT